MDKLLSYNKVVIDAKDLSLKYSNIKKFGKFYLKTRSQLGSAAADGDLHGTSLETGFGFQSRCSGSGGSDGAAG